MKKTLVLLLPLVGCLWAFSPAPAVGPDIPADVQSLLDKHGCMACHAMNKKLVGPAWPDIAAKKYSAKRIAQLIAKPEPANWPGYVPMAPQKLPKAEAMKISNWLAAL